MRVRRVLAFPAVHPAISDLSQTAAGVIGNTPSHEAKNLATVCRLEPIKPKDSVGEHLKVCGGGQLGGVGAVRIHAENVTITAEIR